MAKIFKAVVFDGKARVAVIDSTDIIKEQLIFHNLTPLAANALGRAMTVGAYLSSNIKGEKERFSMTIDGGGLIGRIYVAGNGEYVKGFVKNPSVGTESDAPQSLNEAVGKNGELVVIKDFGIREPYMGHSPLVSGDIAEDFAEYLNKSQGIPNAVALGVKLDESGVVAAGGVFIEALPSTDENILFMLEDIMSNFSSFSDILAEKGAEEIVNFYFGHLNAEIFPPEDIALDCDCKDKVLGIIEGIGEKESRDIVEELGTLEINCDYCATKYRFSKSDIDKIFGA